MKKLSLLGVVATDRLLTLLALTLTVALPVPAASAADAVRGKQLYVTTPGGNGRNCATSSCHGPDPTKNINKVQRGANNPSAIQSAINGNAGGMGIYKSTLTSTDLADIAAYIGNPGAATGPSAALAPTSLSFASTTVGSTSATQTLTLSNSGSAALSVTAINSSSADFVVSGGSCAAGGSVAAGGNCTVLVAFRPATSGNRTGTLSIGHNAGSGTSSAALAGTGATASAVAAVSPTSLSFSQTVGTTAAAKTVTLSNTGTAALTVNTIGFTGSAATDYSVGGGTCRAGGSVAAASSCTILVSFTPAATGSRPATLSIAHSASATPTAVTLAGTGTAAASGQIAVNASTLTFAAQAAGTTSNAQTLTVSNSGSLDATLSGLVIGGTHASDFAIASTGTSCATGTRLAPAGTCTVAVTFTPGATSGTRSGSLSIGSDASNPSVVVSLSGTAAAAGTASLAVTPNSIDFGNVALGTSSATRTVQLSNPGSASLSFGAPSVSPSTFSMTHNCPSRLAPGASCTLSLRYTPATTGPATGSARITSNAASSPDTIALAGNGVTTTSGELGWSGGNALSFGDTAVGNVSAAQTLQLRNSGGSAATIASLGVAGAQAGDFAIDGASSCAVGGSIAAGGSCTLAIVFTPTAAGTRNASVQVASDAAGPGTAALTGNGVDAGASQLSLAPEAITLPGLTGGGFAAQALVLTNSGAGVLDVYSIVAEAPLRVLDATTPGGGTCPPAPFPLQPGSSCSLMVTADGSAEGRIDIQSGDSLVTRSVTVTGDTLDNAGGGGCSIGRPGAPLDPVWLVQIALAAGVLGWRRHQRRAAAASGERS